LSKNLLRAWLGREENQAAKVCLATAAAFCVWVRYGNPKFYLLHVAPRLSLTGDAVIDAELYHGACNLLLIALLVALIKLVSRQKLVEYGLGIGDWRRAPLLVAGTPLMILLGYVAATMPEYQAFYPITPGLTERSMAVFALHAGVLVTHYVAWELLFRGYLQGSLVPRLGMASAIAAQTLVSTLAHLNKPDGELFGSILAGIFWGFLAYRSKSIWPVVLQHLLLGLTLDYWICFG